MSHELPNGKATATLWLQVGAVVVGLVTLIAGVSAPIILMYSKLNTLEVKLSEIETQFKAADDYRNMNLASNQRYISLLWQKTYGESFPTEIYFPEISNRRK